MTYDIKKLLRIVDPALKILAVSQERYQSKQTLIIEANYFPAPKACRVCGSSPIDHEGNYRVVKNGTKTSMIRLENYHHMPTVMKLKKQKYFCRNCHSYTTASPYFIKENCFISEHI
ncbi:transposase family protein, partial [Vagococcus elongatus]